MRNKKGFTIIEVLFVILIIALLTLIAVPTVSKYIKSGTKTYYKTMENELKTAGAEYMETYRSLLPQEITHVRVVDLEELVNNKYIDPLVDEKGNECTGKVTIKKIKTDKYEYYSCIKCGDYYESKANNCDYDETNNVYKDTADYRIELDQKEFQVNQTESFTAPLARVYYKNEIIKSDLEGSPSKVDTNVLGTHEVVYYYHGAKEKAHVTVVDNIKPTKAEVVLKYNDSNGKDYKGEWFSGDIYVKYKSTDYTAQGIMGSGIAYYEVSNDGENFVKLTADDETKYVPLSLDEQKLILEGEYTRYVRAVDKTGLTGEVNSYTVRIDKHKPVITSFSVTSNSSKYSSITISISMTGTDAISGITHMCYRVDNSSSSGCNWYETSSSYSTTHTFPESDYNSGTSHTVYVFAKDRANNVQVSSKTYKVYRYCTNEEIYRYGSWGSCSAKCNGGTKYRTAYWRDVYFTSHSCGTSTDSTSCNTMDCCSSTYSSTGSWGSCSKSCGGGKKKRTITYYSNYDGRTCSTSSESTSCNTQACNTGGGGGDSGGSSGGGNCCGCNHRPSSNCSGTNPDGSTFGDSGCPTEYDCCSYTC